MFPTSSRKVKPSIRNFVAVLAGSDLLVRYAPELIGIGDTVVVPISLLLASKIVLNWADIGWIFGWILYGSLIFQMAPLLIPRDRHEWGHGLVNRSTMSLGAVTCGLFIERAIVQSWLFEDTLFPVPARFFPHILLIITILIAVAQRLPAGYRQSNLLTTFDSSMYPAQQTPGSSRVLPYLLVVLAVAVLLTNMSLFFPLPELLLLGKISVDAVRYRIDNLDEIPKNHEHAERVVKAASAIWAGPRGLIWVSYIVAPLFLCLGLDFAFLTLLAPIERLDTSPMDAIFTLCCLGATTVLVTISSTRFAERIPATLHQVQNQNSSTRSSRKSPEPNKPLLPGFLIPAAIPVVILLHAGPDKLEQYDSIQQIPPLELSPLLILGAITAWSVGVLSLLRPGLFPYSDISDYYSSAFSFTGFFTSIFGIGFLSTTAVRTADLYPALPPIFSYMIWILSFTLLSLSPLIGYELFTFQSDSSPANQYNIFHLVKESAIPFFILLLSVVVQLLGEAMLFVGRFFETSIVILVGALTVTVGVWLSVISLAAIGLRLISAVFW